MDSSLIILFLLAAKTFGNDSGSREQSATQNYKHICLPDHITVSAFIFHFRKVFTDTASIPLK